MNFSLEIIYFIDSSLSQSAQYLIALAILFTFGLQFYIPMDILWRKVHNSISKSKQNMAQIIIRSGIILIMSGVAVAVPDLEPFISLVGAVFFSTLGMKGDIFLFLFFI